MPQAYESGAKAVSPPLLDWLLNGAADDFSTASAMRATGLAKPEIDAEIQILLGCSFAQLLRFDELHGGRMPAHAFICEPGITPKISVAVSAPQVAAETWEISWGSGQGYLGDCMLAATSQGICSIDLQPDKAEAALVNLQAAWPGASFKRDDVFAAELADRVFGRSDQSVAVHMSGTEFQLRVWRALLSIPAGSCMSYGQLAQCIGSPSAARAVGSAVGANPIAVLVPCHRVLPVSGMVGGFRWGPSKKWALLLREQIAAVCLARQAA